MLLRLKEKLDRFQNIHSPVWDPEPSAPAYEFCPRCEANLTFQNGYSNTLPYWVCLGCGEMLINPEIGLLQAMKLNAFFNGTRSSQKSYCQENFEQICKVVFGKEYVSTRAPK